MIGRLNGAHGTREIRLTALLDAAEPMGREEAGVSPHFQLRLTRRGSLDVLTVRAEARAGATAEQRAAAAKDGIGVSVGVGTLDPETPERPVGKFRRIVDEREQP